MSKVYAHRGASAELPENTLPAFARAIEVGARGVELDVHLSRDGVAAVIHDETVDRTTNGSGAVAELTIAELQALDAGGGAPVPTLAEVLDLLQGELHVDIEVKASAAVDAVLQETSARPDLAFAISSFDHEVLRYARSVNAAVELWPLTGPVSDDVIDTAIALRAPQIAAYDALVNAEIIAETRHRGLGIWVWTVNDPDRAASLVAAGAIGICTDDPRAILDRLGPEDGS